MSSLDFWKQVKEAREISKKNKANYQTITISDGIFDMLYKDAERLEKLEKFREIVKKGGIDEASMAVEFDNYGDYTDYLEYEGLEPILTEEEYKLLKEMLK